MSLLTKIIILQIVLVFFPLSSFSYSEKANEIIKKKYNLFVLENNKALFHPDENERIRIVGHLGSILVVKNIENDMRYIPSSGVTKEFVRAFDNESGLEVLANIKDIRPINFEKPKKIAYINADIDLTINGKKIRFNMGEKFNYEEIDGKINLLIKMNHGLDSETGNYKNGDIVNVPIIGDEAHFLVDKRIILVDDSKVFDKKRTFNFRGNSNDRSYECGSLVTTINENKKAGSANVSLSYLEIKGDIENKSQVNETLAPIDKIVSKSTITISQDGKLLEKFAIEKERNCENAKTLKLTIYSIKDGIKEIVILIDFTNIFKELFIKAEGDYLLNTESSNWAFFDFIRKNTHLSNKNLNGETATIILQILMYYNLGSFSSYGSSTSNLDRLR